MNKFEIITKYEGSSYAVSNYQELEEYLQNKVSLYKNKSYSNLDEAISDRDYLEITKNVIKTKIEELKAPYATAIKQLEKLEKIIQEPIKDINDYEKRIQKEIKRNEILDYARNSRDVLGEYLDKVINSPKFINDDWFLKSKYPNKKLYEAIDERIRNIAADIKTINMAAKDKKATLLATYYETLSMESVKNISNNLDDDIDSSINGEEVNDVQGHKTIKIYGTAHQLDNVINSLEIMGLDYEIEEDGFPLDAEETLEPLFDSFIAVDTENTGILSNDDKPIALTEIGVVKVINGEIVDNKDWLINPQRSVVPRIARLTHINDSMLIDKPTIDVVIKEFKEYIGDLPLVGHNIKGADLNLIYRDGKANGIGFENTYFDTNKYAKKYKNKMNWENTKLEYLAEQFGVEDPGHHRADNDAKVNALVYLKLKDLK